MLKRKTQKIKYPVYRNGSDGSPSAYQATGYLLGVTGCTPFSTRPVITEFQENKNMAKMDSVVPRATFLQKVLMLAPNVMISPYIKNLKKKIIHLILPKAQLSISILITKRIWKDVSWLNSQTLTVPPSRLHCPDFSLSQGGQFWQC